MLLALLLAFHTVWIEAATVISNSQLQSCVRTGVLSGLSCSQQLVTSLALPSGSTSLDTQTLNYTLPCINSPDGSCPCSCNYASDSSCTCRDLVQTIKVSLAKSPVYSTYPLTYVQAFNYHPSELTISTGGSVSCVDGALASNPTCGWAKDTSGNQISNSQGFCCACSLSQLSGYTFGTTTTTQTRGALSCNLFKTFLGNLPGAAHCLRFDPLYFEGYRLGDAQMQFEITITVNVSGATNSTQLLTLSPSTPKVISSAGNVSAQLLGDLASYQESPNFNYALLMIPSPSGVSPDVALQSNTSQWLMIDLSLISLDGSACNKVGTSYTAFQFQASPCNQILGSCLSNQLYDYFNGDLTRIAAGSTPFYMVSRWGGGQANAQQAFYKVAGGPLWFGLPVTSITNSLVTLNVIADSLQLVTNESPGKITSAQVCQFNNASCGTFQALTQQGYMSVSVENVGTLTADYQLTVANCSSTVSPILAQDMALAPTQILSSTFEVYVESAAAANLSCTVTLLDSEGIVTDSQTVQFSTSATQYNTAAVQSNATSSSPGGPSSSSKTSAACTSKCVKSIDIACYLTHACWTKLAEYCGLLVSTAVAGILLWLGLVNGWWFKLISIPLKLLCTSAIPRSWKKKKKHHGRSDSSTTSADSHTSLQPNMATGGKDRGLKLLMESLAFKLAMLPYSKELLSKGEVPAAATLSEQRLLPNAVATSNALFQPGSDVEMTPLGRSRKNPAYEEEAGSSGAASNSPQAASLERNPPSRLETSEQLQHQAGPGGRRLSQIVTSWMPSRFGSRQKLPASASDSAAAEFSSPGLGSPSASALGSQQKQTQDLSGRDIAVDERLPSEIEVINRHMRPSQWQAEAAETSSYNATWDGQVDLIAFGVAAANPGWLQRPPDFPAEAHNPSRFWAETSAVPSFGQTTIEAGLPAFQPWPDRNETERRASGIMQGRAAKGAAEFWPLQWQGQNNISLSFQASSWSPSQQAEMAYPTNYPIPQYSPAKGPSQTTSQGSDWRGPPLIMSPVEFHTPLTSAELAFASSGPQTSSFQSARQPQPAGAGSRLQPEPQVQPGMPRQPAVQSSSQERTRLIAAQARARALPAFQREQSSQ